MPDNKVEYKFTTSADLSGAKQVTAEIEKQTAAIKAQESAQASIRSRVESNLAASKAGRESSNIDDNSGAQAARIQRRLEARRAEIAVVQQAQAAGSKLADTVEREAGAHGRLDHAVNSASKALEKHIGLHHLLHVGAFALIGAVVALTAKFGEFLKLSFSPVDRWDTSVTKLIDKFDKAKKAADAYKESIEAADYAEQQFQKRLAAESEILDGIAQRELEVLEAQKKVALDAAGEGDEKGKGASRLAVIKDFNAKEEAIRKGTDDRKNAALDADQTRQDARVEEERKRAEYTAKLVPELFSKTQAAVDQSAQSDSAAKAAGGQLDRFGKIFTAGNEFGELIKNPSGIGFKPTGANFIAAYAGADDEQKEQLASVGITAAGVASGAYSGQEIRERLGQLKGRLESGRSSALGKSKTDAAAANRLRERLALAAPGVTTQEQADEFVEGQRKRAAGITREGQEADFERGRKRFDIYSGSQQRRTLQGIEERGAGIKATLDDDQRKLDELQKGIHESIKSNGRGMITALNSANREVVLTLQQALSEQKRLKKEMEDLQKLYAKGIGK